MMNSEGAVGVLVVDDDLHHRQALARILEQAGYNVTTAADGHEGLALFMERPFDLIITDLRMPRTSGLDLLRSIRGISQDVPVVVVTAFGEWTTYMQAMNIGAVDYLNKPVRGQDILMTIRKALARRGIRPPDVPPSAPDDDADTTT
jgi:two-component system response regulator HydG